MQLLNSKNYESVSVILRDYDEPLMMNATNGLRLMDYLTTDVQTKHVKITDLFGNVSVVLITDIKTVVPNVKTSDIREYV